MSSFTAHETFILLSLTGCTFSPPQLIMRNNSRRKELRFLQGRCDTPCRARGKGNSRGSRWEGCLKQSEETPSATASGIPAPQTETWKLTTAIPIPAVFQLVSTVQLSTLAVPSERQNESQGDHYPLLSHSFFSRMRGSKNEEK